MPDTSTWPASTQILTYYMRCKVRKVGRKGRAKSSVTSGQLSRSRPFSREGRSQRKAGGPALMLGASALEDVRAIRAVDVAALRAGELVDGLPAVRARLDRKSTRLNSSHLGISYA